MTTHNDALPYLAIKHQMAAKGSEQVFVLGCSAHRITLYSQQCRALNLVWALSKLGKIGADTNVAVIGGGASGLTAAAAALRVGCTVRLFEGEDDLLNVQRQSKQRHVHPHIYDWPAPNSTRDDAGLPLLNWTAALADEVASQILEQWKKIENEYKIKKKLMTFDVPYIVKSVDLSGTMPLVVARGSTYHRKPYHCVILAVGPGRERDLGTFRAHSYWKDDDIDKVDGGQGVVRRYLVTGTGDGGLIDALRLRFKDFKHAAFAGLFADDHWKGVREELLKIEEEARQRARGNGAEIDLLPAYQERLNDKLEALLDNLRGRDVLRQDTEVYLNGTGPSAIGIRSSILNRFGVFLLQEHLGGVFYWPGKAGVPERTADERFRVKIGDREPEIFDRVVVRHGPDPAISRITPKIELQLAPKPPWIDDDPTSLPCWGEFYGPSGPSLTRPAPDLLDPASTCGAGMTAVPLMRSSAGSDAAQDEVAAADAGPERIVGEHPMPEDWPSLRRLLGWVRSSVLEWATRPVSRPNTPMDLLGMALMGFGLLAVPLAVLLVLGERSTTPLGAAGHLAEAGLVFLGLILMFRPPVSPDDRCRLGLMMTTLVVMAASILVGIHRRPWGDWHSWATALAQSPPVILGGVALVLLERFRLKLAAGGEPAVRWAYRKQLSARLVEMLRAGFRGHPPEQLLRIRQDLLECIAVAVAEQIAQPYRSLGANLTAFDSPDLTRMRVIARSAWVREDRKDALPTGQIVPGTAIRHQTHYVVDDTRCDPHFPAGRLWYRSVLCIPVRDEKTGRSFGAVSIACDTPFAFFGRTSDALQAVLPYIRALALTFCDRDLYYIHRSRYDAKEPGPF